MVCLRDWRPTMIQGQVNGVWCKKSNNSIRRKVR